MRELYAALPDEPEWLTMEDIDRYAQRMEPPYEVVVYHHFENGVDERLDYQTLAEAEQAAQKYVAGTMEGEDGFAYDGAGIYDLQENRWLRVYGNFPDERAIEQTAQALADDQQKKDGPAIVQLHLAKKEYLEYMSYNDFSIDFLERFANSKNILFNRILTKRNGQKLDINDNTSDIAYRYESTNIRDIIFSSIHFALENGYKLSQCSHCGRWFFKDGSRAGSRKKYCDRKSTFNGYEHLPCEQAVRNINQELQRKKKRIYNSMIREHLSTEQFVRDFLDECAVYMTKIKECASVQNLSDYWTFLKKYKDGVKNGNNK